MNYSYVVYCIRKYEEIQKIESLMENNVEEEEEEEEEVDKERKKCYKKGKRRYLR